MKKLTKFLSYSAIIASAVFIVSCSDDVVDSNTTKDSGIPFKVSASVNNSGTRASDITTLNNFQIWGFTGDATNELAGVNCTPASGGGYVPATTVNWPVAGKTYTFNAVSNGSGKISSNILTPTIVNDTLSFSYVVPQNVASQEDLLVAIAKGSSSTGLNLAFDHALTAATLTIKLNTGYSSTYGPKAEQDYMFFVKIQKIIIHNIKKSGKYVLGKGWDLKDAIEGDIVIDMTDNPFFQTLKNPNGEENIQTWTIKLDNKNTNLYFIPQTINSWGIAPNLMGADKNMYKNPPSTGESYIELVAMCGAYPYSMIPGNFDEAIESGLEWYEDTAPGVSEQLSKDADGNYYDDGDTKSHMVVTKEGIVLDYSSNILKILDAQPTVETRGEEDNTYACLLREDNYGVLYKKFNTTLTVNGSRNFIIELGTATRALDGAAAYGISATPSVH